MKFTIKRRLVIIIATLCAVLLAFGAVGCDKESGYPEMNPLDGVCTVVFTDTDGKYLSHQTVEKGDSVTPPTVDVYKKNHYFSGWSKDLTDVQQDMVVKPVFSTNSEIDGLKLYKDVGERFDVLLIADIQTINTSTSAFSALGSTSGKYKVYSDTAKAVYNTVNLMVQETNPDYLVLMGDNIYSRFDTENLDSHKELMQVMDGFELPWSIIFGNHDGDVADTSITRAQILDVYSQSKYFLFEQEQGAECGDYVVNLIEKGSQEICKQFVFMYTHESAGNITSAQRAWYESKMQKLIDGNTVIPSVMFAHIPFVELYDGVIAQYGQSVVTDNGTFAKLEIPENDNGDFGIVNSFTYSAQHGLFSSIKKYGSTQSVFFGHNHSNDFSVEVDGVRLTHAVKTGFYDQNLENRYLNGATLLSVGNSDYSITHNFVEYENYDQELCGENYTLKSYTNSYDFNTVAPTTIDTDPLFLDYKSSLGSMAGSNKIKLSAGESAYIEFDIIDGLHSNSGSDNMQAGFRVCANPISTNWPSGAFYTYFMATIGNCPGGESGVTMTDGIIPVSYAETANTVGKAGKFNVEQVFKGGTTIRYTVNADGTYTMATKLSGEPASAYKVFRSGTVTVNLSDGFYIGFTANRSITIDNVTITGSDYVTEYNIVGFNPVLGGIAASTYTAQSGALAYIYSSTGKVLSSDSDKLEMEMTLIRPQASITAGTFCAFSVTEMPTNYSPYTTDCGFMINCNQAYITFNTKASGSVSGTLEGVENDYLDYTLRHDSGALAWTGNMFYKSYITYKFVYYGNGNFECYIKSALDPNSQYQKVYQGTTTGVDMTRTLYVGFIFFGDCEIANITMNGISGGVSLNNCTVS